MRSRCSEAWTKLRPFVAISALRLVSGTHIDEPWKDEGIRSTTLIFGGVA